LPFPKPVPGQVIRYSYLWRSEYLRGQEEGVKDRPCVVVLLLIDADGDQVVTVLPITHTPPSDPALAVELTAVTKQRLGLDYERSWVMLTEANRFTWPGPDLCMAHRGDPAGVLCGELPGKLLMQIRDRFIGAIRARQAALVTRSE
jgi:hypothetical protein